MISGAGRVLYPIDAFRRLLTVFGGVAVAQWALAGEVLPQPEAPFGGRIATSVKDSVPHWPQPAKALAGAPNIVVILLDDIGFADTSTFGGVAQTPELDKLAAQGLRYNNFHTTGMCSPTRAALLTGRNHHRVGFGVAEVSAGFPGYNFIWKNSTTPIAEVLRHNGYSTTAFGKWHNTPYVEVSPVGPFDRWPTSLGFEYFYGFIGGIDNQWEPAALYRNTTAVDAPATVQQGYHLTTDIADEAIRWLRTHESLAAERPYFMYFATGAVHEPHHVPKEWIDRYRGRFDAGWDALRQEVFTRQKQLGVVPGSAELTPRPKEIPSWKSLSADQKRLYARQMEVYAGFIAHTDYEIGRLLRAVQAGSGGDNTVILYIVGDNGSTGEAGLHGYTNAATSVEDQLKHLAELGSLTTWNQYSAGWAWFGSTPFQWWKGIASHFGATRTPLVISWPARIQDRGGLRTQFSHVNGVAATLYDMIGISPPSKVDGVPQQPLDGVSFAATLASPDEPSRHHTQYFEMLGNRAIYHEGWVAAARHVVFGFQHGPFDFDYGRDRWELYRVDEDFSQARNVAARYPTKLKELQALFDREARQNEVYPLGGGLSGGTPHSLTSHQRVFSYYPGLPRLQKTAVPSLSGTSYRITAQAVIPDKGAEGVILSYGSRTSGFAFYLKGDRLVYESNREGIREVLTSDMPLPRGKTALAFEFAPEAGGGGRGRLFVDGQLAGQRPLTEIPAARYRYADTLGVGQTFGAPVSDAFQPPFKFSGSLKKVTVQLNDGP